MLVREVESSSLLFVERELDYSHTIQVLYVRSS